MIGSRTRRRGAWGDGVRWMLMGLGDWGNVIGKGMVGS